MRRSWIASTVSTIRSSSADQRHHQETGVEFRRPVRLGKCADLRIPSPIAYFGMNGLANGAPLVHRPVQAVDFDTANGAVEGDPGHDLGVGEQSPGTANLPDSIIGI
jgi:hypothetical protein